MCLFEGHHSWSYIIFLCFSYHRDAPWNFESVGKCFVSKKKKDDGRMDRSHSNGPYWLFADDTDFHLGGYMFRYIWGRGWSKNTFINFSSSASHFFLLYAAFSSLEMFSNSIFYSKQGNDSLSSLRTLAEKITARK